MNSKKYYHYSTGPFTVLAPHDDAGFTQMDNNFAERLMTDPTALKALLSYHVLPGIVMSQDISDGMKATTLGGEEITFSVTDEGYLPLRNNIQ